MKLIWKFWGGGGGFKQKKIPGGCMDIFGTTQDRKLLTLLRYVFIWLFPFKTMAYSHTHPELYHTWDLDNDVKCKRIRK